MTDDPNKASFTRELKLELRVRELEHELAELQKKYAAKGGRSAQEVLKSTEVVPLLRFRHWGQS